MTALIVLAGLWVLLGAVWLAVWPLLERERRAVPVALLELQELEAEKDRLVAEIHELDLDYATGKLSEDDYGALEARLKTRAVDVIREIEARQKTAAIATAIEASGRDASTSGFETCVAPGP